MYAWLCRHLPRPLVDAAYALWYAVLLVLVVYFADRPALDFLYLHG